MSLDLEKRIERKVGSTLALRWYFPSESSRLPEIITGHTFTLVIDNQGSTVEIVGDMFEGDFGVYFSIPAAIRDNAGHYPYQLKYELPNGQIDTSQEGIISYS